MTKSCGFTFIEVLVAVLVLALGLIGLAALQASGVKNMQTAYNRSQAIHLAQDIADRIRANSVAAATYVDVNANSIADYGESTVPSGNTTYSACSTSTGCTMQQMAQADVGKWRNAMTNALPRGCGVVVRGTGAAGASQSNGCTGAVPANLVSAPTQTISIVVNWDDNNDGQTNADDPNFIMSFEL